MIRLGRQPHLSSNWAWASLPRATAVSIIISRSAANTTRSPPPSSNASSSPSPSIPISSHPARRPPPWRGPYPSHRVSADPKTSGAKPVGPPPPKNETPAQKVARLRAQREAELMKNVPIWDRVVVVLIVIYAAVSLTDMVMYNRRKRRAFYSAQRELYELKLDETITAMAQNAPLTDDQKDLVQEEIDRIETIEARKLNRGVFKYLKWLFFGIVTNPMNLRGKEALKVEEPLPEEQRKRIADL
ncbi:MAG: hypothetical protein Q9190_008123, partial [Brigantiaea leucoxantha]